MPQIELPPKTHQELAEIAIQQEKIHTERTQVALYATAGTMLLGTVFHPAFAAAAPLMVELARQMWLAVNAHNRTFDEVQAMKYSLAKELRQSPPSR